MMTGAFFVADKLIHIFIHSEEQSKEEKITRKGTRGNFFVLNNVQGK
jgi:hypothetical protein